MHMINRVETRVRTAKCSCCNRKIAKGAPYLRSQWAERSLGPTWGRNFCKRCMLWFVLQLLFPFFFTIPNRNLRNIVEAKRQLNTPYCPAEEGR